jgi:two-component system osmolarity sensor histidine kinase EnvZ
VQRMGGIFALSNTTSGGLAAHIKLQRAEANARVESLGAAPKPSHTVEEEEAS